MSSLSGKLVIDTNVPKHANKATIAEDIGPVETACVSACIEAIECIVESGGLVLDVGGEILSEYRKNLSMSGQPGVGDRFMKWVHSNQCTATKVDLMVITKNGSSYSEFPHHPGLANFDDSDRKFVAVANAHPDKPPILQATDSKWWGWKDALNDVGIDVCFLCPEYVEALYKKKFGQ